MTVRDRYLTALQSIPPEGSGVHCWMMGVANLGAIAGLPDAQVELDMRDVVPAGRLQRRPGEVREAVDKAYRELGAWRGAASHRVRYGQAVCRPRAKPTFDGPAVRARLVAESHGAQLDDLLAQSPVPVDEVTAARFLASLYSKDEWLFVGHMKDTGVCTVEMLSGMSGKLGDSPHIIPNPLTGEVGETRTGGLSMRCDAAVKAFRFALVEFDGVPKDEQCAFWMTVLKRGLLRVATLIDSGGKSIHGWIRVDLPDRAAWDREVAQKMYDRRTGVMSILGADPACKNPSRLSRMPLHLRSDTRRPQRLLYLNPDA